MVVRANSSSTWEVEAGGSNFLILGYLGNSMPAWIRQPEKIRLSTGRSFLNMLTKQINTAPHVKKRVRYIEMPLVLYETSTCKFVERCK